MFRLTALVVLLFSFALKPDAPVGLGDAGDWPQWRGPHRDGISSETGLLAEWSEEGPPLAWKVKGLGKGYSSVSIAGGKIFTMGRRGNGEMLMALDAKNGNELWATEIGTGDHSNCTPTVDGDLVFGVGLKGDLVCVEAATGKLVWKKNYGQDFGGAMMSGWGYSESPLVDGNKLICTPGAKDAMIAALDKRTGNILWKAAQPDGIGKKGKDGAAYSSVVIGQGGGVRQYIQLVGRGLISVDADSGKVLWTYNRVANGTANIPTPIVHDDYVFCSSGYQTGAALLKLNRAAAGGVDVEEVYFLDSKDMQNHHGGMILLDGHIYCGHGHNLGLPLCIDMLSGKDDWRPGRGPGEGSAAISYADGRLYFRYQNGVMALIEATPKEYVLKGSFKIPSSGGPSWPHPAIAQGHLYLRDQDTLLCYDIRKTSAGEAKKE
jgi:outer membrane protein assembly factor BamB